MAAKPENDGVKKFLESLPEAVKENVEALRGVQAECDVVRGQYLKEKKELEEKYHKVYEPLFDRRAKLVIGADSIPETNGTAPGEEPGAVPGFWLRVLKNPDMVSEHVTRRDEPILKYLLDLRTENLEDNVPGFRLVFKFAPNPYFKPLTLEKKYFMGSDDESVLEKTEGTEIEWSPDKNPTFKLVKKKPSKGNAEPKTKMVQTHSFFDFFSPPEYPKEGEQAEDIADIAELLAEDDFEMGCYIKEVLVPNAVSWFTGELADERDTDDDDLDDDDDSSEYSDSDSD
ncbi:hypothetical protein BSKO_05734 [Bryopsis sp. KO-2023]|nr:hypothetical protein BSKO_05734 [Bryopsis sp. KO-2023]